MRTTAVAIAAILIAVACTKKDSPTGLAPSSPAQKAPLAAQPAPAPKLDLSEERLAKFVEFKRVANGVLLAGMGAVRADAAPKNGEVASDALQQVQNLRRRYGFAEAEEKEINEAIRAVLAGTPEANPLVGNALEELRAEARTDGPGRERATRLVAEIEEGARKALAEARLKYGDAVVGVLSKRARELAVLQAAGVAAALGAHAPPVPARP